ncbi:MAG TPA: hypothetical protein EYH34_14875 [Planctomycetes bacterium]|nr:hypothetical protein [Planctomycetota bacterium]
MSESAEPVVQFRCPHCTTLLSAATRYAGARRRCPCCHGSFIVPTPEQVKARAARIRATGAYELSEGNTSEAAGKTYIPVRCPVCGTGLFATPEEVGSELACPDCETKVLVPPLETMPAEKEPSAEELAKRQEEYGVLDDADQLAWSSKTPEVPYIGLKCSLCGSRLLATEDQIGQEIVCPDCQQPTLVRAPPPAPPPLEPEVDHTEQYATGPPPEEPDYSSYLEDVLERGRQRLEQEDRCEDESRRSSVQPARLRSAPAVFFTGIFQVVGYDGVWQRWVGLSVATAFLANLFAEAMALAATGEGKALFLAMGYFGLLGVLGGITITVACPLLLTVLQETAAGKDRIEAWPDTVWLDWLLESLYFASAAGASALVATALSKLVGSASFDFYLVVILLLFPPLLLSMLAAGTPWNPLYGAVWKSYLTAPWAWGIFYVESILVMMAARWLSVLAHRLGGWFGLVALSPLLAALLIVYFRLLGRLAWVCSGASAIGTTKPPASSDELPYERFIKD